MKIVHIVYTSSFSISKNFIDFMELKHLEEPTTRCTQKIIFT